MNIKISLALTAILAASTTTFAQDTIDISGLQSWGLDGNPDNETGIYYPGELDPELGYIILTIDYDITIQTFDGSWLDEVNIRFGNSDGTFDGDFWPDTFIPGQGSSFSGTQRFVGSFITDIHLNEDAEFRVTLFEDFDDNLLGPDAVLLPGSTMTLGLFIPSPGTANLLLFGVLITGTRRRR
jgi:hypothetical protein